MVIKQMELFPEQNTDPRSPETVTWNMHHGCTKVSQGCQHCYMFRRDESVGRDPRIVRKTKSFNLLVRILRSGPHKGRYKVPPGSMVYTCFSSDFFHKDADEWREELWDMIRERSDCTFFMITKRPERIAAHLPSDWGDGSVPFPLAGNPARTRAPAIMPGYWMSICSVWKTGSPSPTTRQAQSLSRVEKNT